MGLLPPHAGPEFADIKGWLNSKPLTVSGLKGKVVLLDFWTYSCVNCLRTLPHLKQLYERYQKYGFVLVGAHTPEFDFERMPENVAKAVKRLEIPYPVALDSENTTWTLYGNRYWPRQTLLDKDGKIRWGHAGEGGYAEMEEQVRKLLTEAGVDLSKVKPLDDHAETPAVRGQLTAELYCGSARNPGFGSSGVCTPTGCKYLDADRHENDVLYPVGEWHQTGDQLILVKGEGTLALKYTAAELNLVLVPPKTGKGVVEILLDGKPLTAKNKGADVNTKSTVSVDRADMYRVVKTAFGPHEILLKFRTPGTAAYAFTFG